MFRKTQTCEKDTVGKYITIQQAIKTGDTQRQAQDNAAGYKNREDPEAARPRKMQTTKTWDPEAVRLKTIQQAIKAGKTQRQPGPGQYNRL